MSAGSQKPIISEFLIFPKTGMAPLNVAFAMKLDSRFDGKMIWNFGDGKIVENTNFVTSHSYEKNGEFSGKVEIVDTKGATLWKNEFKISVMQPQDHTLIKKLQTTNGDAYALTGDKADFVAFLNVGLNVTKEINWDFGDQSKPDPSHGRHDDAHHVYKTPGERIVTVSVKTVDNRQDSGSLPILILDKNWHIGNKNQ